MAAGRIRWRVFTSLRPKAAGRRAVRLVARGVARALVVTLAKVTVWPRRHTLRWLRQSPRREVRSDPRSRRRWRRAQVGTAVLLVLAVVAVPDGERAGAVDEPCADAQVSEAAAVAEALRCGRRVQVAGLTSETVEAWALPSGLVEATVSAGVARVRRGDGWVPLDLNLVRRGDGKVAPVAHPNDLVITGMAPTGEHELAGVGLGGDRVAMSWSGALPEPVLNGPTATFVDALPDVDLAVQATPEGFEQFFVVKSRAAVEQVQRLGLALTGATVAGQVVEPDGTLVLLNGAGKEIARVPTPRMWDSRPPLATGEPARSAVVPAQVAPRAAPSGDAGGLDLTLVPDPGWMLDAATVFPVVIDPTVSPVSSTFSTTVLQNSDGDRSAKTDMWIGLMSSSPPAIARSFVHWPSSTFIGKQIVSARVYFWNFYSTTCTPTAWQIWSTGPASATTYWSTQPQWIDANPSLAGDQPEATSTETKGFNSTCNDNWVSADARSFFQRAADAGQSTAYMGIRAADEAATSGWKQFYTRNHPTTSVRPYATVTYNSYPQVTSRATVPATVCVTGSSRPMLATLTPTLQATVSDAEGTAMSVTFEWWTLSGSSPLGSATVSPVASGGTASATVPAGGLTMSGSYKWRVKASDGTGTFTSSWCEFTLYEFAPPAEGCSGTVDNDFTGDGVRDVAIADPDATVAGLGRAGVVYVVDGASGVTSSLTQDLAEVPDAAESSARFGHALAVADLNEDGCSDLVVGVPLKNVGAIGDAGSVYVLFGSPQGLAKGPASLTLQQGLNGTPETAESSDFFGFSVAAGKTAGGEPFLVIGAPGENLGSFTDAGTAHYLFGDGTNVLLNQDTAGVPSSPETDDRVGYAVSASPYHVAVAGPGEAAGTREFAGIVHVFRHALTSGVPTFLADISQDATGVVDSSEAGDMFGRSISMASYRPVGAPVGQPDSLLVVGVPGEDFTGTDDAGLVQRFHLTATGFTELPVVTQNTAGIFDSNESGDYFGERVLVVNTDPAAEASASTLLVAVGSPGEDLGTTADSGAVHVFAAAAATIALDAVVYRNPGSLPGAPIGLELVGLSLGASVQDLYVGTPHGAAAVYALPWSALAGGSAAPSRTWQPGVAGVPAGGYSFGAAVG